MTWHRVIVARLLSMLAGRRLDRDLDEELRAHLEMETEANIRCGMAPDEARREALRSFGGVEQVKESYRDRRGIPLLETLWQDIRYALRLLGNSPGFTAVAVLSLALGIGANTAVFTLMDQIMLRLLPVRHPEELVSLSSPGSKPGMDRGPTSFSYPLYQDLRDHTTVFTGMLGRLPTTLNIGWRGQSELVNGELVTGNYFDVLGIQPFLGRLLGPEDDRHAGAHPVVVISYDYWRKRFAADPSIAGKSLKLTLTPMTIIGVAPPGFHGLDIGSGTDVFVPMMMKAQAMPGFPELFNRGQAWLEIYARLKPGVSRQQAGAAMGGVYRRILQEEAKEFRGPEILRKQFMERPLELNTGSKGRSGLRSEFSPFLLVLGGMVGLVLLIATANLAGLLTARAAARQREIAVRLALGAGRLRIVRQLIIESLLLSVAGGAFGLWVSSWGAGALLRSLPYQDAASVLSPSPDLRILVFTLAVSIAVGLLFGLLPALQATRPDVVSALKAETRCGTSHTRFRNILVICQVALSVILTIGAILFARTLYNLRNVDMGMRIQNLLTFSIDPSLNDYSAPRALSLDQEIESRLARLPGVRSVHVSALGPLNGPRNLWTMLIEGYQSKDGQDLNLKGDFVSPGALAAAGIPVRAGREFSRADALGAPKVGVVSQKMARLYFPGQNPIGKRVGFKYINNGKMDIEIVGVVGDCRGLNLREEALPSFYLPYLQFPYALPVTFHVRTALPAAAMMTGVEREVRKLDPDLSVFDIKIMEQRLDESLFVERGISMLAVSFGLLATFLAALGLYGVISFSVVRRTREIGIRMALGAKRTHVIGMVLRDAVLMVLAGIAVGLPAAYGLMRLARSLLYGIAPADGLTMAGASLVVAGITLVATCLPARAAIRIDPLRAIRYE